MNSLRIASINIERSKHLTRVEKFLKWYQPDVLCLQELCARDIPFFEDFMGNKLTYAPMCLHAAEVDLEPIGVGLVAWGAMENVTVSYYEGIGNNPRPIQFLETDDHKSADPTSIDNALIFGTYQGFRIATTHLNVTPKGESTPFQLASAARLLKLAKEEATRAGGLLMTGDFNAPRGRPTFSLINEEFEDGVPASYTTSIDGNLHRAGPIPFMVDGLFHTQSYKLMDAQLHTGVSDHCALTCTLTQA